VLLKESLRKDYQTICSTLGTHFRTRDSLRPTEVADVIFPAYKVSFLIIDFTHHFSLPCHDNSECKGKKVTDPSADILDVALRNLECLRTKFKRRFALVLASSEPLSVQLFGDLQLRHSGDPVLLPCADERTCVLCMMQLINLEALGEYTMKEENEMHIMSCSASHMLPRILARAIGVTIQEMQFLLDTFSSVINLAGATEEEIIDCTPLPKQSAKAVVEFFNQNTRDDNLADAQCSRLFLSLFAHNTASQEWHERMLHFEAFAPI
jgi:hypothetical protein